LQKENAKMEKLILEIAKAICDKPELVKVDIIPGSKCSIIEVKVDQTDLGKMIGNMLGFTIIE
jgi:predicted RNA-binding protein YlqC (UPF0109 family)